MPGDNLSELSPWPFVRLFEECWPFPEADFVLFSMLAKSFGLGVESAPIELHVCASNASGLFFASSWNETEEKGGYFNYFVIKK